MPVTTTSAAVHITPVIIKTFFTHRMRKAKRLKEGKKEELPQDDIFYDQAFHIVKAFIQMGINNTVESLQRFTNTHVPSPHWAAVVPVLIPLSTCNQAADVLVEWFGPQELQKMVGGERWWQVRGLDGVDAEWVTERKYLGQVNSGIGRKISREEETILRMEDLETVMLYIHGGGYFWGSINTHRYQILRYARKFRGRAFAVNYRKAPQYPWPCAIQDVLAAYLYLIDPPENAVHKPIPPHKITIAGDSAGGGLCLVLLTILRDLSRPLPAGAVFISPWVDLTHSFPSIMQNTVTDIIPEHGFLAKPSTLWPLDLLPPEGGRVAPTEMNPPSVLGEPNSPRPCEGHLEKSVVGGDKSGPRQPVKAQEEVNLPKGASGSPASVKDVVFLGGIPPGKHPSQDSDNGKDGKRSTDVLEPKPPKLLMQNPNAVPLELRSQIQLYAATEQLTHPLVSPVFQGSLGGLPPLYIIAGDGEVLRDEAIYLAHRAAFPEDFPAREGILYNSRRQKENVQRFTNGTKVHLQVFDGMCHVPTILTFATNTRYAYRSIAEFVKHVTQHDAEYLEQAPFPSPESMAGSNTTATSEKTANHKKYRTPFNGDHHEHRVQKEETADAQLLERIMGRNKHRSYMTSMNCINMIRERVNVHGQPRPLEPAEEIPILKLKPHEVGLLREAPALRWKEGQDKWDHRYKKNAISAMTKRRALEVKAERLLRSARGQGLAHPSHPIADVSLGGSTLERPVAAEKTMRQTSVGETQHDRRWGPLDLEDECPPRSAIAKRRDTPEALALLKKHIYFTAPITHQTVPRMKRVDAIRAAVDPNDNPNRPPRQSVSEQQQKASIFPVNGLRLWDNTLLYFGRKSAMKTGGSIEVMNVTSTTAEIVE